VLVHVIDVVDKGILPLYPVVVSVAEYAVPVPVMLFTRQVESELNL